MSLTKEMYPSWTTDPSDVECYVSRRVLSTSQNSVSLSSTGRTYAFAGMHIPGRYPNGSTTHQRQVEHLGEFTDGVTFLFDGLLFVLSDGHRTADDRDTLRQARSH